MKLGNIKMTLRLIQILAIGAVFIILALGTLTSELAQPGMDTGGSITKPTQDSVGFVVSTITVTNLNDAGVGSLRQAIMVAAPGDTIEFGIAGTIVLSSGELVVDKDLIINGPGPANLAVDGNSASRVFNITAGSVAISGITIKNGGGIDQGGGI